MTAQSTIQHITLPQANLVPAIFSRINLIMSEVGGIAKDRTNAKQGYKFRGIDDVYLALQPLLAKHEVFTTLEVLDEIRSERTTQTGSVLFYSILKIRYDFWALDGSKISCTVIGEGMDSGDKASNKAMSIAQKYAFIQIFAIPTEDPKDPENDSHDVTPEPDPRQPDPAKEPPKAPTKPSTAKAAPKAAQTTETDCEHIWRDSKWPNKETGGPEQYCTKCKAKRPKL